MLTEHAAAHGLDIIQPGGADDGCRAPAAGAELGCSGFVYYVSITGVTGTRTASVEELGIAIPRIRQVTDLPIAVGFGVRSPAQAAVGCAGAADAAVVASALIDTLAASAWTRRAGRGADTVRRVLDQVRALAGAISQTR